MTTGITDRLTLQLQINGQDINLTYVLMDYCHIVENVRLALPAMTIQLQDTIRYFSSSDKDLLVDGVPVVMTVGVESRQLIFPMRLFSHKEKVGASQVYILYCYLDLPAYWTASTSTIISGTASSALQQICSTVGLTYSGVTTNDQQIWIPANKKYREFARQIADHAYVDANSCCQLGITASKVMRLVNISDFTKTTPVQTFSNAPVDDQLQISDWELRNRSGFLNVVSGYQDTVVSQSMLRDDVTIKDMQIQRNTQKLMMNSDVKSIVSKSRVQFSPLDSGNVNPNYYAAAYQNARGGNLFSTGLEFVTGRSVTAELMDIVNCQISRTGVQGVSSLSGNYMVTSKNTYIYKENFYQKLEVFRHGLNDSNVTSQV